MRITPSEMFLAKLKEGEHIAWSGQPKRGFQIREIDIILIPASIILCGFAVIMDIIVFSFEGDLFFKIFSVMLSFMGLYMGILRFFSDMRRRARTFYCITDKRVMMIFGKKKKLKTLPLKNIENMQFTEEKNGRGHITFGRTNPLWPWLFGQIYLSLENIPGLENIAEANHVFALLESLKHKNISAWLENELKEIDLSEN